MIDPKMLCPKCNHSENRLLSLREHKKHNYLRRRRVCQDCEYKWSTLEIVERQVQIG